MIEYRIEAIDEDEYPKALKTDQAYSPFDSTFTSTMETLGRECRHLSYRPESLTIKTFHRPYDVLKSGKLRAEVKKPLYPAVIVWFEVWDGKLRRYIPMQFECDTFNDWKSNLRAIALGMEALRKVDRYGISSRGAEDAHHAGYKQLPPKIELGTGMSVEEAAMLLSRYVMRPYEEIMNVQSAFDSARMAAARQEHPDKGGEHEQMAKINLAVETLKAHFNGKGQS